MQNKKAVTLMSHHDIFYIMLIRGTSAFATASALTSASSRLFPLAPISRSREYGAYCWLYVEGRR